MDASYTISALTIRNIAFLNQLFAKNLQPNLIFEEVTTDLRKLLKRDHYYWKKVGRLNNFKDALTSILLFCFMGSSNQDLPL